MFEEHSEVPQTRSGKSQRNRSGGPNGSRTRVSALRGPCPRPLDDGAAGWDKSNGWERRTRTSTTGSRAPRPTIRRSPSVPAILRRGARDCQGAHLEDLENGPLERPAGLEARHAAGRNLDGLARPGIPAVALGAPRDQEGAEAADGHLPALPEGVEDLVQERVESALRGDLGSARGLRHGRHEVRLRHGSSYLRERGGESQDARSFGPHNVRRVWEYIMRACPGARLSISLPSC